MLQRGHVDRYVFGDGEHIALRMLPCLSRRQPVAESMPDVAAITKTLDLLCPEAPVELRVKLPGRGMDIKRFTDHLKAADWVLTFPHATAAYVLMNPFSEERIKEDAVDDGAVTRRWWLLLDVDHDRAADTNATNGELQRTDIVREAVKNYLTKCGWPDAVEADSGNGRHLLYRIDLPNDDESKRIVNGVLAYLNRTFSRDGVHIDTKVGNASRITKLYGTMTRKGPATVERPHRLSCITRIPETLQPVAVADLKKIANLAPTKSATEALPQDVVAGSRNTLLFREGCRLRRLGLDEKAICAALTAINTERCRPALDGREVETVARSCAKYEPAADLCPCTEAGDAEFFAACNADSLRFDHLSSDWLLFKEHFWSAQTDGEVYRLALDSIRARQGAAVKSTGDGRAKRISWALGGEARKRLTNQLALAQNIKPLADAGDKWNLEGHLLGVQNGVIDLHAGTLRPGRPEDRITLVSPLSYDSAASIRGWEKFILEVCDENSELAAYFQVVFGYILTGETREQAFWIFFGEGANGKSTLLEIVTQHVIPNHSWSMNFPSDKWSESMSDYQKAQLAGRRLVVSKENEKTQRLNTEFIKSLTGDEKISARHPYGRPFEFDPVAKFIMAVNHKPKIVDETHAMWRRVRLVPFLRTFPLNPGFAKSLAAESAGALAWAVQGAVKYYREGMTTPEFVLAATQEYRQESDALTPFFTERCVIGPDKKTQAQPLFEALRAWYDYQNTPHEERLNQNEFGNRMGNDKRFTVTRGTGSERKKVFYCGIGLVDQRRKDDDHPPTDARHS